MNAQRTKSKIAEQFAPFKWLRSVTDAPGLSVHAVAVGLACMTMQHKGRIAAVGMDRLAALAHTSRRSAERGISELTGAGLLTVKRRGGRKGRAANGYGLTFPANAAHKVPATLADKVPTQSANAAERLRRYKSGADPEIFAELAWPETDETLPAETLDVQAAPARAARRNRLH